MGRRVQSRWQWRWISDLVPLSPCRPNLFSSAVVGDTQYFTALTRRYAPIFPLLPHLLPWLNTTSMAMKGQSSPTPHLLLWPSTPRAWR